MGRHGQRPGVALHTGRGTGAPRRGATWADGEPTSVLGDLDHAIRMALAGRESIGENP